VVGWPIKHRGRGGTGQRRSGHRRPVNNPISRYPGREVRLTERGPLEWPDGTPVSVPFIDWIRCTLIATALLTSKFWTIAVLAVEVTVLTCWTGHGLKRLLHERGRLDGKPTGAGWDDGPHACELLAVVPPLVTDRGNGAAGHDKARPKPIVHAE